MILWGLSFFFGCRHLSYVNSNLYANGELLKVEAGIHPETGQSNQLQAAASSGIREAMEYNSSNANKFGHLQFKFLVLGSISYILWHILEMVLRTL